MKFSGDSGLRSMFAHLWLSEDSGISRRSKQLIAFVVPRPLLIAAKKRYYAALVKNPRTPREADMEALNQVVRPGDFALDIGAFVGFYAQRLSQLVGATGEVWAFEPVPETFSMLSYVVGELSLNNVRVLNVALSDATGQTVMEIPRYRRGGEALYGAHIVSHRSASGLRAIATERRTLDSILSGDACRRTVRFMKLDVEFHELHAVRGAIDTIRRDHPVILTEWLAASDPANSRPLLQDMLEAEGYKAFHYVERGFVPCAPDENRQNRFFLTQSHVAEFAQHVRWD
jgi:FkbM family methyltransferase